MARKWSCNYNNFVVFLTNCGLQLAAYPRAGCALFGKIILHKVHYTAFQVGECKSWTLDSGLDHGLDFGLEYGLNSRLIF